MMNKYNFNKKESIFLLKKNLISLIYSAGKFENLPTTLLDTDLIINYKAKEGTDPFIIDTILQIKRGYQYIFDNFRQPNFDDLLMMNEIVAKYHALFPGQIRVKGGGVNTRYGHYIPPLITEKQVKDDFNNLLFSDMSVTEKALRLFLYICKKQVFYDGNKRTAFLMCNYLLGVNGKGMFIINDEVIEQFFDLLSKYYLDIINEGIILDWLYNKCLSHFGYSDISIDNKISISANKMFNLIKDNLTSDKYLNIPRNAFIIYSDSKDVLLVKIDDKVSINLINLKKNTSKCIFSQDYCVEALGLLLDNLIELEKLDIVNKDVLNDLIMSIKESTLDKTT